MAVRQIVLVAALLMGLSCERSVGVPIVVVLPEAPGVREGSPVEYLGVTVGEVTRISFLRPADGPPRVALDLRLTRDSVPLRQADSVRIHSMGIFGDRALAIIPGPSEAAVLGPRDTLLAATYSVPPRLEAAQVLEALARGAGAIDSAQRTDTSAGARPSRPRP